ncbi:DUF6571 family protein [Actinomyces procaprae]|uniref:DUF6571 family protein n=1 Tax=Actinomyces procaprae TaxID=2560010 RepID=UPI0010A2504F|nr:DUF6571 family protein [Actinomyces procaprae]
MTGASGAAASADVVELVSSGGRAAQALSEAVRGSGTGGVGVSELVRAAAPYAGDPVWANEFITALGADNLTGLPLAGAVADGQALAHLLGRILATASTTWNEDTRGSMAAAVAGSVADKGEWGRITALNAILTAPAADTEADTTGAEAVGAGGGEQADSAADADDAFAPGFLTALADELAGIDPDTIRRYRGYANTSYPDLTHFGKQAIGGYLTGNSFDPLTGVLEAIATHPQTALDYLTGTAGDADRPRFKQLSQRQWDQQGLAAYTTAIAAATTQRTSTSPDTRQQADQLAGQAITYLAASTTEDQYTPATERAIANLLANSPAEVTCALNQDNPYKSWRTPTCDHADSWFERQPSIYEPVDPAPITALAWRITDTPETTSTIANALAEHARTQAQTNLNTTTSPKPGTVNDDYDPRVDAINIPYQRAVYAISYLAGLTENKTGTNTYNHALITGHTNDDNQLSAMAIQDAANAGLLNPEDYTITGDSSKTYTWIVTRPDGTHTIDLSQADDPTMAAGEVSAWVRMVQAATGDYVFKDITDDFSGSYTRGYDLGSKYGG